MQARRIYPLVIWFSLLLMAVPAFGADETVEFPTNWSHELQASTRNVVQAGLDQDDALLMTRTMSQARFQEQQIVQAQHIIAATLEKDLPVEPVMNKAYEGMTKKVVPSSIVRAMERVTSRYEYAYSLAGQLSQQKKTKEQLGNTLAGGLAAGMTRGDMDQLVDQLRSRERHMEQAELEKLASECLFTVRDMARQGVSSDTAVQVVNRAMNKGFGAQEMQSMRNSFMARGAQGSAESVARDYSNAIAAGKEPQANVEKSSAGHGTAGPGGTGDGGDAGESGGSSGSDGSDGNGDAGGAGDEGGGSGSDGSGGDSGAGDAGSGSDSGEGSGGSGSDGSGGDSGAGDSGDGPGSSGDDSGSGDSGNGSGGSGGGGSMR